MPRKSRRIVLLALALALATLIAQAVPSGAAAGAGSASATATAAAKKKKKSKARKCPARKKSSRRRGARRASAAQSKRSAKRRSKKAKCPKRKAKPKAKPKPFPGPPMDYRTLAPKLSQPIHREVVREAVEVPMADGINLYIEVIRPKAPGRYGVILEASGYHGTIYDRTGTRILPGPTDNEGNQIGLAGYFPPRGYAVVMMDLRGTGRSEGCLDHIGPKDQSDLRKMLDWAASQPWSNGRVGILGHSYLGGTSAAAGSLNHPALKTFVPSAGLGSMYHHQFQAGVPYSLQWVGTMEAYEQLAIERHLPPLPVDDPTGQTNNPGDNFGNDMQYFGCGMTQSSLVAGEDQLSGRYSQWHRERDFTAGATRNPVPAFVIHGVNDEAARVAAIDWFTARNNRAGDKLWLGQWDHGIGCCPNRRAAHWTWAIHAWFDKHLLQREVDTGPPVEIFLNDEATVEDANEARKEIYTAGGWPGSPNTVVFHPSADGVLGQAAAAAGDVSFSGDPRASGPVPLADPEEIDGATFASAPAERDMLFIGVPQLDLTASQTVERLHVIATLFVENAEGDRRRITQCAIQPELREGLDRITPVVPGAQMKLKPPCFPMAHKLRKGHKLVLRVTTSDPDKVAIFGVDPNVTVYTGPDATTLRLPLVEGATLHPDRMDITEKGIG